jgi:hypothetical protein
MVVMRCGEHDFSGMEYAECVRTFGEVINRRRDSSRRCTGGDGGDGGDGGEDNGDGDVPMVTVAFRWNGEEKVEGGEGEHEDQLLDEEQQEQQRQQKVLVQVGNAHRLDEQMEYLAVVLMVQPHVRRWLARTRCRRRRREVAKAAVEVIWRMWASKRWRLRPPRATAACATV